MELVILVIALIAALVLFSILEARKKGLLPAFYGGKAASPVGWIRSPKCKYQMNAILRQTLEDSGIKNDQQGELMFPCSYNYTNSEIKQLLELTQANRTRKIFIIGEGDQISNKMSLWVNLRDRFGLNRASQMMPMTYVLYQDSDLERFKKDYRKDDVYIMKNNVQRQHGLKVTRDLKAILKGKQQGYIIVQKMLQDPYLIENRKINIRIYMLVVCQRDKLSAYMHRDGFMYYTKKSFEKNSVDPDKIITTGYIDRSVYERNPLTLEDFRKYLDSKSRPKSHIEKKLKDRRGSLSVLLFERIKLLLHDTIEAVRPNVCQNPSLKPHLTFQLYGVDVAINYKLQPSLMEINKGPDMGGKDKRDTELKTRVTRDIFKVIGAIQNREHGFMPIY
jgi:hypothetical protein